VLDELRRGALHLTGLFLLAPYLDEQNAPALLTQARGWRGSQRRWLTGR
jgi:hypothetical protein